jgi:hypothetical protein
MYIVKRGEWRKRDMITVVFLDDDAARGPSASALSKRY